MKPAGGRKERLEPLSQEFHAAMAPSPLDLFPSKHDTITKAIFGVETKRVKSNKRKIDDNLRWLYADKIDADFGLMGNSHEDSIRRAYRRIESSALFTQVNSKDAPLSEIVPSGTTSKRYVVVEESRLQELTKLENTLRKEKQLLGEQCGWALNDFEVNARIPMPAIGLAVHGFCEQQLQSVAKDVLKLKQNWEAFCRQNHYNKPHLYIKDSYVNTAPVSQRAMKLRLVRSAVETWRLRKDRDTMLFEDDLSYLMGKYHDARIRQKDYERYYILAARYGPYSDEEFNKDPRPGRRYFIAASKGAIKFQMLWDRFWSMAKLRRYRAARMIQKYYRRRFYYKMYHPIINLRLKIGKKTYYIYCWHAWLHYNYLCRKIKEALNYQFNTFIKINFVAWKRYVHDVKHHRETRASQMIGRAKNTIVYFKFKHWVRYTASNRRLKIHLRRLFGFPHFDLWVQYVKWAKHMKHIQYAAAQIQAMFKMNLYRKRFLRKKAAVSTLRGFNKLVLCVRLVRRKRREAVLMEFAEWSPGEMLRRANRLNDIERQRLVKRQQFVAEKEKGALAGLRKHLNSKDGQLNLDALLKLQATTDKMNARYPDKKYNSMSKEDKCKLIAKSLGEDCAREIRLLESHNYNTKQPPFIECADVRCCATCTSEAQYHSHLKESPPHLGNPPQFSDFHMMLRHQRGQEILRTYLTKLHGIGGLVTYLDAYFSIQEWKKLPSTADTFESKALNILELYLLKDSARRLDLSFPEAEAMVATLNAVKNKEHKGLYRLAKAKPTMIRGLLGVTGQEYYEFTTEGVLPPDVFQQLEWHCFSTLFQSVDRDERFKQSAEFGVYTQLLEEDKVHRQEEFVKDYEKYRLLTIRHWTRGFCDGERAMFEKAGEIVDVFMKREVDAIYKKMELEEVRRRTIELRRAEQAEYEATTLLTEDVYFWVEDTTLDTLFEHYTTSLINKMLEIPECRKGLLQYGGFLKAQTRHMHLDTSKDAGKEEWFTDFYKEARKVEKGAMPLGAAKSVVVIQRHVRGVQGRKKAKRVFMKVYSKLFDPQARAPYYLNNKTGESSWTRPLMTRHLYKRSNW